MQQAITRNFNHLYWLCGIDKRKQDLTIAWLLEFCDYPYNIIHLKLKTKYIIEVSNKTKQKIYTLILLFHYCAFFTKLVSHYYTVEKGKDIDWKWSNKYRMILHILWADIYGLTYNTSRHFARCLYFSMPLWGSKNTMQLEKYLCVL